MRTRETEIVDRGCNCSFGGEAVNGRSVDIKLNLAQAVEQATQAGAPSMVTLRPTDLTPGMEYIFQVTVTNFLGRTASAQLRVVKSATPIPKVLIEGGSTREGTVVILWKCGSRRSNRFHCTGLWKFCGGFDVPLLT